MCASGWDPDITTYNIRIHGFCSSQKMSRAALVLDELISAGIVPNTVTYNTMLNAICADVLDRAMILTAKLIKMAFVPDVITTNVLLSQFYKQGMPERTLMWAQKLADISFDFNEVSYSTMNKAYRAMQNNIELSKPTSEKSMFLDFLMYITYEYFARNRPHGKISSGLLELMENG
uniref:Pentatricopeptide repeat-containing protein n=1 Tax=Rhizophora mucronata TaxID=61149 RepID=A0A2P2MZM1_RHIMU